MSRHIPPAERVVMKLIYDMVYIVHITLSLVRVLSDCSSCIGTILRFVMCLRNCVPPGLGDLQWNVTVDRSTSASPKWERNTSRLGNMCFIRASNDFFSGKTFRHDISPSFGIRFKTDMVGWYPSILAITQLCPPNSISPRKSRYFSVCKSMLLLRFTTMDSVILLSSRALSLYIFRNKIPTYYR